jgi:hypothetical protein
MLFIPRHYWHLVHAVDRQTALQWTADRAVGVDLSGQQSVANKNMAVDERDEETDFSISVSLWWGKRIEKDH